MLFPSTWQGLPSSSFHTDKVCYPSLFTQSLSSYPLFTQNMVCYIIPFNQPFIILTPSPKQSLSHDSPQNDKVCPFSPSPPKDGMPTYPFTQTESVILSASLRQGPQFHPLISTKPHLDFYSQTRSVILMPFIWTRSVSSVNFVLSCRQCLSS